MAKIKTTARKEDAEGYGQGANRPQPQPGVYDAKIVTSEVVPKKRNTKINHLHIVAEVVDHPKYAGAWLHDYVDLPGEGQTPENSWKEYQLLVAMGVLEPGQSRKTVTYDTDTFLNRPCQVRVKADSYNGEYQAKLGTLLPPGDLINDDEDDEEEGFEGDDDEVVEGEVVEEGGDEDEEFEDAEEGEEEEEEEGALTQDDIVNADKDGLKGIAEANNISLKGLKTVKAVREHLMSELFPDDVPF